MTKDNQGTNRRSFLAGMGLAGGAGLAGVAATSSVGCAVDQGADRGAVDRSTNANAVPISSTPRSADFSTAPIDTVRIGFVGVGLQGGSHVRNFLRIDGIDVRALCDIDAARASEVASWVTEAGFKEPSLYTGGDTDWQRMIDQEQLDLVFNATPWQWHVPVSLAAMEAGVHAAIEVPAATTVEDCWRLVEAAERTQRHCVMMENCCYGRSELMTMVMARRGLFGELLHVEGAYIHDLRAIKLSDANEGLWRWQPSTERDANLYPTHGLGPVAQVLDINRGDQFDHLVSMSSPSRGLGLYANEHLSADDPRREAQWKLGDMNTSLIKTKLGRTILLQHDTTTPRPYSRLHHIQGTKGTFAGFPDRIYVEGRQEGGHRWEDIESYREEFEHPLWRRLEEEAAGAGHGGMDYLEDYRLIQALRLGQPMDMNVYDAAAVSAAVELSERSVAQGSAPQPYPDFTRGLWQSNAQLPIVT